MLDILKSNYSEAQNNKNRADAFLLAVERTNIWKISSTVDGQTAEVFETSCVNFTSFPKLHDIFSNEWKDHPWSAVAAI